MKPLVEIKQAVPDLRGSALLIFLMLACFAFPQRALAVVPAPDGGYPGGNTAEGHLALGSLTTGMYNNAVGIYSLLSNTTGNFNTATGAGTLLANTADQNTATGAGALLSNNTGDFNTANGAFALFSNTEGRFNVANGDSALFSNTTGTANIALGYNAGFHLTTGGDNIDIGNNGATAESDTIRIGTGQTRTFIAGISGVTVTGTPVVVNANGQLGVAPSSQRFKDEIKPMANTSEAILALKPVTFRYKKAIDPQGILQFGLVAEEVEAVNPDLVVRGQDGKAYSVRYEQINAMLLNEFLKEHRKVAEQEATIAQQRRDFEARITELKREMGFVVAHLREHDSKIQKVSDQIEVSKPAPQVVLNP